MKARKTKVGIKVKDKIFKIRGLFKKSVVGFPFSKDDNLTHNNFWITVENVKSEKKIGFNWYDSFANYQKDKINLNELDLIYCFKNLIDDGITRIDHDLNGFFREFGYTDIEQGLKVWDGLKKQLEKCYKLGFNDDELFHAINFLNELENKDKLKLIIVRGV